MINDLLFAIWFFLPAGLANVTPILVVKLPLLKHWNTPLDLGKHFEGRRLFGDHKTWRGMTCGVIAGILTVGFQSYLYMNTDWVPDISGGLDYSQISIIGLGLLLGFGALGGDALKSFFKRHLAVNPGDSWFPFDQLDYIAGGLVLSSLLVRLTLSQYILIILIWFGLHLFFSYVGYLLKLKAKPI